MNEEKLDPGDMLTILRNRLKQLPAGDDRRLDVLAVIQAVEGDLLGGNGSHARRLATDQESLKSSRANLLACFKDVLTD